MQPENADQAMPSSQIRSQNPLFYELALTSSQPTEKSMTDFASLRPLQLGVDGGSAFQAVAMDMEILLSLWQAVRPGDIDLPGINASEIYDTESAYMLMSTILNRVIGETSPYQDTRFTFRGNKDGLVARLVADTLIAAAYSELWDAIQSKDTWAPCKNCGTVFRRRSRKGKFCSPACQVADSRSRSSM